MPLNQCFLKHTEDFSQERAFFLNRHPRTFFITFRERKGERMGEKH